ELRVVVGVGVDEARAHDQAVGVELLGGGLVEAGGLLVAVDHGGDAPAGHPDVAPAPRRAGAVDDRGPPDDEIEHVVPPTRFLTVCQTLASPARPRHGAGTQVVPWSRSSGSLGVAGHDIASRVSGPYTPSIV